MSEMKCKDFIGKRVRLVRDIQLRGGVTVTKGTEAIVDSTWSGLFTLVEHTPPQSRVLVHGVARHEFEVVE